MGGFRCSPGVGALGGPDGISGGNFGDSIRGIKGWSEFPEEVCHECFISMPHSSR